MPRQAPPAALDEAMIHALVHGFYARVRADAELGPIFERAIGDHWDTHLATMCDFWSSVMLTSGRYKGNPMMAHVTSSQFCSAVLEPRFPPPRSSPLRAMARTR